MNSRISAVVRAARLVGCTFALGGAVIACGVDASERASSMADGASSDDAKQKGRAAGVDGVSEEAAGVCGPSGPPDGAVLWNSDLKSASHFESSSIASDAAGNVFHARRDTGVDKLSPDGVLLWHLAFGNVVTAHAQGDAYVGSGSAAAEAKVTKLDASGATLWSLAVGNGTPQSIAVAADRSVLISGQGLGTIRLDAQGQVQWTKPFGGYVAFSASGDALVTGSFEGTIDLGAGPVVSRGREDAFIVRLSSEGTHRWSHILGDADLPIARPGSSGGTVTSPSDQQGKGIAEAPNGDVVVTGFAHNSIKLFGNDLATPYSNYVGELPLAYVARLDPTGNVLWKTHGFTFRDVRGLAVDPSGNAIVSGGTIGNTRPYVLSWFKKYDPSGGTVWEFSERFGSGYADAVTTDGCGNILLALVTTPRPTEYPHAHVAKLRP
ncbi:PQQ-binding-like beta-propeller repeat protein [Pendulispora albinea]|uniref:Pyrrolo-quinoline quinone repeat domain-containing protein n=1 Tax=Pendulispora albinea TaxID=2741071 RepID=A0ABZ2LPW3_9BACT